MSELGRRDFLILAAIAGGAAMLVGCKPELDNDDLNTFLNTPLSAIVEKEGSFESALDRIHEILYPNLIQVYPDHSGKTPIIDVAKSDYYEGNWQRQRRLGRPDLAFNVDLNGGGVYVLVSEPSYKDAKVEEALEWIMAGDTVPSYAAYFKDSKYSSMMLGEQNFVHAGFGLYFMDMKSAFVDFSRATTSAFVDWIRFGYQEGDIPGGNNDTPDAAFVSLLLQRAEMPVDQMNGFYKNSDMSLLVKKLYSLDSGLLNNDIIAGAFMLLESSTQRILAGEISPGDAVDQFLNTNPRHRQPQAYLPELLDQT